MGVLIGKIMLPGRHCAMDFIAAFLKLDSFCFDPHTPLAKASEIPLGRNDIQSKRASK